MLFIRFQEQLIGLKGELTPKFEAALDLIHTKYSEEFDVDGIHGRVSSIQIGLSVDLDMQKTVLGAVVTSETECVCSERKF